MKAGGLTGRTVVVAGATGAIGCATCASLLREGATVVAAGQNGEKLRRLEERLRPLSGRLHAVRIGGLGRNSWDRVLAETANRAGPADVFIHALGMVVPGAFLELSESDIESILRANFMSVVSSAAAVLPSMAQRRSGHFVVVGSLGGLIPMPFETMYSATKFALRGFCLSLHEELRPRGVTVSLVAPGPVRTPMLHLEGSDPRAALTFFDAPVEPETIADDIVGILHTRKREIVRPSLQRYGALAAGFFPGVFGALYPLLHAIGRRKLLRYRESTATPEDETRDHRTTFQTA